MWRYTDRMGKGKRIKVDKGGQSDKILKKQLRAFRKQFGRDPYPGEPVFFNPDADAPRAYTQPEVDELMRQVAEHLPPSIAYAYLKTNGMLLTESNMDRWSAEDLAEWNAAIDEYYELQEKQEDEPN